MKNVNRDYLVTVDAKTAAIKPPRDMKFFITDILTCNIFFQLVSLDSNIRYAPVEDINNYTLTLRVVKPNKETKEFTNIRLLNEDSNFLIADLTPDYTDYLGIYECELFIDAVVTTEDGTQQQERSTTDSFTYEVIKSVFTAVDEVIEGDPDYPGILDSFATRDYVTNAIKNMDLYGFATRDYVNQVVNDYIDLSEYVTDKELEDALSNFSGPDVDIDLSDYATKDYVDASIANAVYQDHTIWVGTQAEYDAIAIKDSNTVYFIEEE